QSVPQRQQPLGAERSSVQLLIRCNGNLAVIDCRRRLAAQRDSVVPDYVDAHEWVLLIDPAAVPPVTPLTLSSPTKATPFPIILWRCWARSEHGITQPTPHGLPVACSLRSGSGNASNTLASVGGGSLSRLARVRR